MGENNEAAGGDLEFAMSDTIVYLCVAVGVFIIIVSFLGCVGATMQSRCLVLECVGIGLLFNDEEFVRKQLENQWNDLSDEQQETYEEDNNCTDFDDCYDSLEDGLKSNMHLIGGITIG